MRYIENGKIDKFATWVNAHEWSVWLVFILAIIIAGIVETL